MSMRGFSTLDHTTCRRPSRTPGGDHGQRVILTGFLSEKEGPVVHLCAPPVHEFVHAPPGARPHRTVQIDGQIGDLWRCDVDGRVWRVAHACDACDAYGVGNHHGQCGVGREWRPATLWQQFRYRRSANQAERG
jgi:hypothetical protein